MIVNYFNFLKKLMYYMSVLSKDKGLCRWFVDDYDYDEDNVYSNRVEI